MGFKFEEDNKEEVKNLSDAAVEKALETIGIKIEKYAKALCPVGTPESTGIRGYRGGTLRNSITHQVEVYDGSGSVTAGSNVEYAPYVELGTGNYFTPPPEWIEFNASHGSGIGHGYVHARPFLRPAIENHLKEFMDIIKHELGA